MTTPTRIAINTTLSHGHVTHVRSGDRTVAFRADDNGLVNIHFDRDLAPVYQLTAERAEAVADAYLYNHNDKASYVTRRTETALHADLIAAHVAQAVEDHGHFVKVTVAALDTSGYAAAGLIECDASLWSRGLLFEAWDVLGNRTVITRKGYVHQLHPGEHLADVEPCAPAPCRRRKAPQTASIKLGSGWSLSLDRREVYEDDPGAGTPAMVYGPWGASVTLWAAEGVGIALYNRPRHGDYEVDIPEAVQRKLYKVRDIAVHWVGA